DITGQKVSPYTINLPADWNIIGPFDIDVAVSGITSTPPGIIASNFYGFNNGYFNATTLSMGKGYWVKLNQAGTLNLPSSIFAKSDDKNDLTRNWGKINITDAVGNKITLFVGKDVTNIDRYELPPIPPQGIFDVRYESNRMVEQFSTDEKLVRINAAIYPIRISVEGIELRIVDKINGKLVDKIIKSGDELYLDNEQINLLGVQFINMPFEFALYQNYPNPFNPNTKIKFQIPNKEKVKLTLFNVLGEVVAELVNGELEAGFHEIDFIANKYSSGLYIYKLETSSHSAVKKMMLLK
ncbi:MAG: T9SS type A sorting domain-containing protein, partial [Ignavibacteria bacterium]|nr:T9SS type A sorting domain-containing protein [Ignavibacteria bacterium]